MTENFNKHINDPDLKDYLSRKYGASPARRDEFANYNLKLNIKSLLRAVEQLAVKEGACVIGYIDGYLGTEIPLFASETFAHKGILRRHKLHNAHKENLYMAKIMEDYKKSPKVEFRIKKNDIFLDADLSESLFRFLKNISHEAPVCIKWGDHIENQFCAGWIAIL